MNCRFQRQAGAPLGGSQEQRIRQPPRLQHAKRFELCQHSPSADDSLAERLALRMPHRSGRSGGDNVDLGRHARFRVAAIKTQLWPVFRPIHGMMQ
jgi:hypothetical protein